MKLAFFLPLISLCLWIDHLSGAGVTNYKGFIMQTTPAYRNTIPLGSTSMHRITVFKLNIGGPWTAYAVWKCGRRCYQTKGCASIVVEPNTQTCHLTRLDRCNDPTNILNKQNGFHFYELILGNSTRGTKTCYDICMAENNDCALCGRPNCRGERCETCVHHCWEKPLPANGPNILWTQAIVSYPTTCYDRYQLWNSVSTPGDTPPVPLELRMNVSYSGMTLYSLFDFVRVKTLKLTVGNYTNGTAGNWWEAPFVNRAPILINGTTCKQFYYPPTYDTCDAVGTTGFVWYTGDNITDTLAVTNMQFWMRKIETL